MRMSNYKYTIETITPLNIRNNEKYKSFEIIPTSAIRRSSKVSKGDFYVIDFDLLMKHEPNFVEKLIDIFRFEEYGKISELISNIDPQKYAKYQLKKYDPQLKISPQSEIIQHIKTNGKPFIPGSSIKGSFISALLREEQISDYFKQSVSRIIRDLDSEVKRQGRKNPRKIYSQKFQRKLKELIGDHNISIAKFIKFSDTYPISPENFRLANIKIFAVNGKKIEWFTMSRQRRYSSSSSDARGLITEVINSKTVLEGVFDINDFETTVDIIKKYERERTPWLESTNLLNKLLNIEENSGNLLTNLLSLIRENVGNYIQNEIKFARKYDIKPFLKFYSNLQNKNENLKENQILLQIGFATGFLSKVLWNKVDFQIVEGLKKLQNLKVMKGRIKSDLFPKTRRVILKNEMGYGEIYEPLGWVKLTFEENE